MTTKLAIHSRQGSFSDRWIKYCREHKINYEIVNCYDSNIVEQLKGVNCLLWHWAHHEYEAQLVARQIIVSIENMGIKVFPNINTCWHYDDKVGQKYLLESINAPLVPSYVFLDRKEAMVWIEKTKFPKVFKLRSGAGSQNVKLVRNRSEAQMLCRIAFGRGFKVNPGYFSDFTTKFRKTVYKRDYLGKIKRLPPSLFNIYKNNKGRNREKGYIYFQDFIADNNCDTRVTVVGKRAFAFRRMVRKNDFRASGSGDIVYDQSQINIQCIKIAFEVAARLQSQSMAFDFIEGKGSKPLIVEVSYCYIPSAVKDCQGYWDMNLQWHERTIWPQDAILEDIIAEAQSRDKC